MTNAHLTAAILSLVFAVILLVLLRRDHIHVRQALFWLLITSAILLFGFAPSLVDWVGAQLGISYPPIILTLAAILVLLVKGLEADLAMARMERRLRRLSQRLAIYEDEALVEHEKDDKGQ